MSYHPDASTAPARLGRYELLGQLATGGMAEIHLARLAGEAGFEKIVVVKRLLPELVASKAFVAMFLDEAKLVSRLDHPNICEVHELGRDGADYFIVMPYLDGVPASDFIARPRDPDRIAQLRVAAAIISQACAGLHHAHELRARASQVAEPSEPAPDGAARAGELLGLVHRDVSPSNLFVTTAGAVKVLDFGIAKVRGAVETEVGTIKGKSQYMAPEQVLGEELDRRCDVFALGIVLFELATHQRLFKRASEYLAARAILEEPIPRADAVDPAVPRPLADVIERALARDRGARFPDARELARALDEALIPYGGCAPPDAIAAALADWHHDELSAQRTRQARVLDLARGTGLQAASERDDAARGTGAQPAMHGAIGASSVTRAPEPDPSSRALASSAIAAEPVTDLATQLHLRQPRRRLTLAVAVIGVALAGGIAISLVALGGRASDVQHSDVQHSDVQGSDVQHSDIQGSDVQHSDVQGSDVHHSDVQGSDGRGSDGRGSDGRGSDGRGSDGQIPDEPVRGIGSGRPAHDAGHVRKRGMFSIDSTPYATIYVDGVKLDVTPILRRSVPAGRHRVRAILADGKTQDLWIDVPAGALAKPVVLQW